MKNLGVAIIVIIMLMTAATFFKFGRSSYLPILHKIRGEKTIEFVMDKIETETRQRLKSNFDRVGLSDFPEEIILVVFKEERKLQVYAKDADGAKLIKEYPFTAYSGELGPKLKEGDRQIPEGVYKVEYLNPNSSYYLSIKINYPNEFDQLKSRFVNKKDMGGDIFIHGKSVTIGCIPIGDEAIEEVFAMVQKAFSRDLKVIVSPRDFRVDKEYPNIESVDWENELYDIIIGELNELLNM